MLSVKLQVPVLTGCTLTTNHTFLTYALLLIISNSLSAGNQFHITIELIILQSLVTQVIQLLLQFVIICVLQ